MGNEIYNWNKTESPQKIDATAAQNKMSDEANQGFQNRAEAGHGSKTDIKAHGFPDLSIHPETKASTDNSKAPLPLAHEVAAPAPPPPPVPPHGYNPETQNNNGNSNPNSYHGGSTESHPYKTGGGPGTANG